MRAPRVRSRPSNRVILAKSVAPAQCMRAIFTGSRYEIVAGFVFEVAWALM
jgi:hypothetical protein